MYGQHFRAGRLAGKVYPGVGIGWALWDGGIEGEYGTDFFDEGVFEVDVVADAVAVADGVGVKMRAAEDVTAVMFGAEALQVECVRCPRGKIEEF